MTEMIKTAAVHMSIRLVAADLSQGVDVSQSSFQVQWKRGGTFKGETPFAMPNAVTRTVVWDAAFEAGPMVLPVFPQADPALTKFLELVLVQRVAGSLSATPVGGAKVAVFTTLAKSKAHVAITRYNSVGGFNDGGTMALIALAVDMMDGPSRGAAGYPPPPSPRFSAASALFVSTGTGQTTPRASSRANTASPLFPVAGGGTPGPEWARVGPPETFGGSLGGVGGNSWAPLGGNVLTPRALPRGPPSPPRGAPSSPRGLSSPFVFTGGGVSTPKSSHFASKGRPFGVLEPPSQREIESETRARGLQQDCDGLRMELAQLKSQHQRDEFARSQQLQSQWGDGQRAAAAETAVARLEKELEAERRQARDAQASKQQMLRLELEAERRRAQQALDDMSWLRDENQTLRTELGRARLHVENLPSPPGAEEHRASLERSHRTALAKQMRLELEEEQALRLAAQKEVRELVLRVSCLSDAVAAARHHPPTRERSPSLEVHHIYPPPMRSAAKDEECTNHRTPTEIVPPPVPLDKSSFFDFGVNVEPSTANPRVRDSYASNGHFARTLRDYPSTETRYDVRRGQHL